MRDRNVLNPNGLTARRTVFGLDARHVRSPLRWIGVGRAAYRGGTHAVTMTGRSRQIAVVLAALFNVGLNGLAGAGLLLGRETGAVSDAARTPITPAGWTFAVWSVIFVGVLVFAVWQALPEHRGRRYDALGVPFVAANLLNGLWQIPWLLERFGIAALVIAGILASLIWLYVRLDAMRLVGSELWALGVPTAMWMTWLAVAAPLNWTIWLRDLGWVPTGDLAVAAPVAVVVAIGAVVSGLLSRTGDAAAALVALWAYLGIWAKNGASMPITAALTVAAFLVLAGLAAGMRRTVSAWPTAQA